MADNNIVIIVRILKIETPKSCSRCRSKNLESKGYREVTVRGKGFDKQVSLRRLRCLRCGRSISERVIGLRERARYTEELREIAKARVLEDGCNYSITSRSIKRDFRKDCQGSPVDRTIYEWIKEEGRQLKKPRRYSRIIHIDETFPKVRGRKRYEFRIVDAITGEIIHRCLLKKRDKESFKEALTEFKEKGFDVDKIIRDGWKAYDEAIEEVFPEAEQKLCEFHLKKNIKKALSQYKKSKRKGRKGRRRKNEIEVLKEELYHTLEADTLRKARRRTNKFLKRKEEFKDTPLEKVVNLFENHFEKIFLHLKDLRIPKTNNGMEQTHVPLKKPLFGRSFRGEDSADFYLNAQANYYNEHRFVSGKNKGKNLRELTEEKAQDRKWGLRRIA